jgi:hypothetical protein
MKTTAALLLFLLPFLLPLHSSSSFILVEHGEHECPGWEERFARSPGGAWARSRLRFAATVATAEHLDGAVRAADALRSFGYASCDMAFAAADAALHLKLQQELRLGAAAELLAPESVKRRARRGAQARGRKGKGEEEDEDEEEEAVCQRLERFRRQRLVAARERARRNGGAMMDETGTDVEDDAAEVRAEAKRWRRRCDAVAVKFLLVEQLLRRGQAVAWLDVGSLVLFRDPLQNAIPAPQALVALQDWSFFLVRPAPVTVKVFQQMRAQFRTGKSEAGLALFLVTLKRFLRQGPHLVEVLDHSKFVKAVTHDRRGRAGLLEAAAGSGSGGIGGGIGGATGELRNSDNLLRAVLGGHRWQQRAWAASRMEAKQGRLSSSFSSSSSVLSSLSSAASAKHSLDGSPTRGGGSLGVWARRAFKADTLPPVRTNNNATAVATSTKAGGSVVNDKLVALHVTCVEGRHTQEFAVRSLFGWPDEGRMYSDRPSKKHRTVTAAGAGVLDSPSLRLLGALLADAAAATGRSVRAFEPRYVNTGGVMVAHHGLSVGGVGGGGSGGDGAGWNKNFTGVDPFWNILSADKLSVVGVGLLEHSYYRRAAEYHQQRDRFTGEGNRHLHGGEGEDGSSHGGSDEALFAEERGLFVRRTHAVQFGTADPKGDLARFRRAVRRIDEGGKVDEILLQLQPPREVEPPKGKESQEAPYHKKAATARRWRAAQHFLSFKDFTCENLVWPPPPWFIASDEGHGSAAASSSPIPQRRPPGYRSLRSRQCYQKCDGAASPVPA